MATIMRVGGGGAAKKKATLDTIAEGALVAARENGVLTEPVLEVLKKYGYTEE